MNTTRPDLRNIVKNTVRKMPPDLVEQLAELERRGHLDRVLERAFARARLSRTVRQVIVEAFRAELSPALSAASRLLKSNAGNVWCTTIHLGASDVLRVTENRRRSAACRV